MLWVCQIGREWVFHFHFASYDFSPPLCDFAKLFIILLCNRSGINTSLQYIQKPASTISTFYFWFLKEKESHYLLNIHLCLLCSMFRNIFFSHYVSFKINHINFRNLNKIFL